MKNVQEITGNEIINIISSECEIFKRRASITILGKKVTDLSMKVLSKTDSSLENNNLHSVILNDFKNTISKSLKSGLVRTLENGGNGSMFIEEVGSLIHKYITQEAYYRSNNLKKKYCVSQIGNPLDRKNVINDIVKTFECDDLQLDLSESFNEEYDNNLKPEEENIVGNTAKQVEVSITDAESKAEVTRLIIDEFKNVAQQIKEEQDAMKPTEKSAEEVLKFNSTEFIKNIIPISATRFQIENSKGSFTKKNLTNMILTLEEYDSNLQNDIEFIKKRIEAVKHDCTILNTDTAEVTKLENVFDESVNDVFKSFQAFNELGFGKGDLPSFKTDPETLELIKNMADLSAKNPDERAKNVEILMVSKTPILTTSAEFVTAAFESFELDNVDVSKVSDFDEYVKIREVRDDILGEFLINGLQHVSADELKRLKEIRSGLRKLAIYNGFSQVRPERLKAIFYNTAKANDIGIFIDFNAESERVKDMVRTAYSTSDFDNVVDDFFDKTKGEKVHVSEENLYEAFAYKAAMEISAESNGVIDEIKKKNIKNYSLIYASYFKTLECFGIVSKLDIKQYVKTQIVK